MAKTGSSLSIRSSTTLIHCVGCTTMNTLDQLSPYVRLAHIFRSCPGFCLSTRKINDHALLYFKNGNGTFSVEERSFRISPGALFVIPPDITHSFAADDVQPFEMLNLHFDPVYQPGCEKIRFERHVTAPNPRRAWKKSFRIDEITSKFPLRMEIHNPVTYERLFYAIEGLWKFPDPANRLMVKSAMIELLSLLLRHVQANSVPSLLTSQLPMLERAVQFMREHSDRPLPMSEVATHAGMSRSHFSTCFGAYYGVSPAKFHLQNRIELAAVDLAFSTSSVKEIAEKFGFQTIHHFTRCFARAMNLPPAAYRETHNCAQSTKNK